MTQTIHIEVGKSVPDFTLSSSNGQMVRLSYYRGRKVVLYFYPKDMTPGCTQQACSFRDYHSHFEQHGAVVLGISADRINVHQKFITQHQLPFLLLSDTEHKVAELFGVWQVKHNYGRSYYGIVRSTFLIDEQGILVKEWRSVKVKGHVEEVLAAVRK